MDGKNDGGFEKVIGHDDDSDESDDYDDEYDDESEEQSESESDDEDFFVSKKNQTK
jgi:hypothetical protein